MWKATGIAALLLPIMAVAQSTSTQPPSNAAGTGRLSSCQQTAITTGNRLGIDVDAGLPGSGSSTSVPAPTRLGQSGVAQPPNTAANDTMKAPQSGSSSQLPGQLERSPAQREQLQSLLNGALLSGGRGDEEQCQAQLNEARRLGGIQP